MYIEVDIPESSNWLQLALPPTSLPNVYKKNWLEPAVAIGGLIELRQQLKTVHSFSPLSAYTYVERLKFENRHVTYT